MLPSVRSRRGLSTGTFLLLLCVIWLGAFAAPVAGWWTPQARPYAAGGRFGIDTDLLSRSRLSAWAIDRYLAATTPLPPLGTAFMAAERRYGINARYLLAHAMLESGFGTSDIARFAHNLFGYNAFDRDPWRYATRFRTYQEGIDQVAHRIRDNYLVPGGRFWGGAPTLRGMHYYASDSNWGHKIAAIADGLNLPTLTSLGVRFDGFEARDDLRAGARARLTIRLDPGREGLPPGIRFAVRFRPVSIGEADPATARLAALPASLRAPAFRAPSAVSVGSGTVNLTILAPTLAGQYAVDALVLDRDGSALPDASRLRIGSALVRVVPRDAVTFSATHVRGHLRLRATNIGTTAIPAVAADAARDSSRAQSVVEAWGLPLAGGPPALLARSYLVTGLAPGGSIDVTTGDLEAILPAAVVVSLRPAGNAATSLGPPAVFRVEAADPSTRPTNASAADAPVTLRVSRLTPHDPISARLLNAAAATKRGPAPASHAAMVTVAAGPDGGLGPSAIVRVRAPLVGQPVPRDAASAPPRTPLPAELSGDASRVTISLDAVPVGGAAADELLAADSIVRRSGPTGTALPEGKLEIPPDPAGPAAYLAIARIVVSDARGTTSTDPQIFWLIVPGTVEAASGPATAPVPVVKPTPKPKPKPRPRPKAKPRPVQPSYRIYVIVNGDTLWSIAHRSGWSMDAIRRLNPWVDRLGIHPGDVLKIPI
jgi:hypothetical protein